MSHFDVVSSQPLAIMSSKFEQMDQYSPHSCDREALKGQKGQSGLFLAYFDNISSPSLYQLYAQLAVGFRLFI